MQSILQWLKSPDPGQYAEAFESNGIEMPL